MVNFLVHLGWSDAQEREFFDRPTLIEAFGFEGMGRTNSVFNLQPKDPKFFSDPKLMNMNAHYLRTMPLERLLPHVQEELERAGLWQAAWQGQQRNWFMAVVELLRSRFQRTTDFVTLGKAHFSDIFERPPMAAPPWLSDLVEILGQLSVFEAKNIEATLRSFLKQSSVKAADLIAVVRTAVTGQPSGPDVIQILICLGQERVVKRLRSVMFA